VRPPRASPGGCQMIIVIAGPPRSPFAELWTANCPSCQRTCTRLRV
jgi:hypothetical protein